MLVGIIAAAYASPFYAAGPSTMFSVAVLKGAVADAFVYELETNQAASYSAGSCTKNPGGQHLDKVNKHFPMTKKPANHKNYTRIFYECTNPSADLFGAFGAAAIAASAASTGGSGVKEPVRVVSDTIEIPPPGGACTATMCLNGTYRKTTDWQTCPVC
jgi:hypothetical protein